MKPDKTNLFPHLLPVHLPTGIDRTAPHWHASRLKLSGKLPPDTLAALEAIRHADFNPELAEKVSRVQTAIITRYFEAQELYAGFVFRAFIRGEIDAENAVLWLSHIYHYWGTGKTPEKGASPVAHAYPFWARERIAAEFAEEFETSIFKQGKPFPEPHAEDQPRGVPLTSLRDLHEMMTGAILNTQQLKENATRHTNYHAPRPPRRLFYDGMGETRVTPPPPESRYPDDDDTLSHGEAIWEQLEKFPSPASPVQFLPTVHPMKTRPAMTAAKPEVSTFPGMNQTLLARVEFAGVVYSFTVNREGYVSESNFPRELRYPAPVARALREVIDDFQRPRPAAGKDSAGTGEPG